MNIWLRAVFEAAEELATTALGCELSLNAHAQESAPGDSLGCFVALTGQDTAVHVGVAADNTSCQALSQSLLGEPGELSSSDVADALGEIVNIVAGGVKKRMDEAFPALRLGLPLVVQGRLHPGDHQCVTNLPVRFGEIPARLVLVYEPTQP